MLRKKQQREAAQKALEEKEAKAAEEYAQWAWEQEQISIKQRQKWRAEEERQQLIDSIKRKYGNPLAQVMINSTRMVIKHTDRSQGRKIKDDFAIYFKLWWFYFCNFRNTFIIFLSCWLERSNCIKNFVSIPVF